MLKLALALIAILGCALALLWWWNPCVSPEITVTNATSAPISEVVISGSGFREPLGELGPGRSVSRSVQCDAESGLELSFSQSGNPHSHDDLAYIESCGGYRVALTVNADESVAVSSELAY